jgi:hypothetical protein
MLPDICSELGLQLAFPGATLQEKEYVRKLLKYEPTFVQRGEPGDLFGREWIPFCLFCKEPSFYLVGKPISIEALVKFVRHKLGGAHFDPIDRKRWQKELKFLTDRIALMQSGAMNYQMAAIAKSVVTAIDSCGIEYTLRRA